MNHGLWSSKLFGIYIDMMLLIINHLKYILLNIFFIMKNLTQNSFMGTVIGLLYFIIEKQKINETRI